MAAAFTGLIALLDGRLDALEATFPPDQGASWYFWKLPNPTALTRGVVWTLYAAHQLAFWGLIRYGQKQRLRTTSELHRLNWWLLGMNAGFAVLHLAQTHWLYDGIAQDVSIWSSQGSVVLLLVVVLVMENRRRGLFFGRSLPFETGAVIWLRRYHGYLFSWAIVYTFWYHPMTSTPAHLIGFLYMFMLMAQGSLIFTRAHLNRTWTTILEVTVLVHGTTVAIYNENDLWAMFFFGFLGIFVITQMFGLGWPGWARWTGLIGYIVAMAAVYSQRGWDRIDEVVRIPVAEYVLAVILVLLVVAGRRIGRFARRTTSS